MNEDVTGAGGGVEVNPAAFEELVGEDRYNDPGQGDCTNLDLLMDVSVPVTVCVGTVKRTIADVLALAPGSVIDLGRMAGDPVDLLVNDKLIARGEVVVVDDRYGLRITEIVAPSERLGGGRPAGSTG